MLEFEWDDGKAASNLAKHGVVFADAKRLFDDIHAQHYSDRSMDYEEERFIGMVSSMGADSGLHRARRPNKTDLRQKGDAP
ncbi:BrnT family toxin [Mesorhizobium sp.]|uniref:BrnT family toxin n=1 Tax=Mesorhizobium sp. TaxID=1871066 RepID=UPI0025C6F100|nr:BrnT family toxin [Mesorhizobium sp.]